MTMTAVQPLPVREDWAPAYLAGRGTQNRDFAFNLRDAQGADGYHSAVDWFAPAFTPVVSPVAGRVVRSDPSRGTSGQVFGGVLAVEDDAGFLWVMRHVNPGRAIGEDVEAGEQVGAVTDWTDGGDHLHLEIWKRPEGGYHHDNMIDPMTVEWVDREDAAPVVRYWIEELPFTQGGNGPAIRGQKKGYAQAPLAHIVAAGLRASGRLISTVRGTDDRTYVLEWLKGTHGRKYRFGPWTNSDTQEYWWRRRETNTGRTQRRFSGNASIYPWPK